MMQVVQSELEICHVPEAIGLSLECFDLVVDPFNQAAGYTMEIVVQESVAVVHEGGGDSFQFLDSGFFGVGAPGVQEQDGVFDGVLFPEFPELLLH